MLIGQEFAPYASAEFSPPPVVNLRRIPLDETWPAAPTTPHPDVLDDWFPAQRDHQQALQQAIESLETQAVLLDESGAIRAVNRRWRLTADLHGLNESGHGSGLNYLAVCRTAASEGCRDAAAAAEGIDGVCNGRCRSFYYKYAWRRGGELRYYLLYATRIVVDEMTYAAVAHELLEVHAS